MPTYPLVAEFQVSSESDRDAVLRTVLEAVDAVSVELSHADATLEYFTVYPRPALRTFLSQMATDLRESLATNWADYRAERVGARNARTDSRYTVPMRVAK